MHMPLPPFPATPTSAAIPCPHTVPAPLNPGPEPAVAYSSPPLTPCARRPDGKATGPGAPLDVPMRVPCDSADSIMEAIAAHQRSLSFPIASHSSPSSSPPQTQAQAQARIETRSCAWPSLPLRSAWAPDNRFQCPVQAHPAAPAPASRPSGRRPRQRPAPLTITPPSSTSPSSVSPSSASSASSTSSLSAREFSLRSNPTMPGRPVKRSAGSGDDEQAPGAGTASAASNNKVKLPRLDRGPDDFSSVVKNRLQSYTRTGQACDRCKVRKIRCDALPEGCSHCTNQNLECYVTDRVTGRTERRGYLQELEREKSDMMSHIRDLEKLLGDKGIEVKPYSLYAQYQPDAGIESNGNTTHVTEPSESWSQVASALWVKNGSNPPHVSPPSVAAKFRRTLLESRRGDAHIGVRGDDSAPLSSIKGTQLSILGTTVDMASFEAADTDEPPPDATASTPLYNKSTQALLQSTMNINPVIQPDLPSREDAFMYSEWYFMTISSFLPLLHQPSFMRLLTRIYDEPTFVPTVAELVQVHMVFAIIFFQYGVRNWQKADQRAHLNDLSNKHYHYALSKFFHLTCSPDLAAVQAMAMISLHTRAFPKPGSSSVVVNHAFHRALELNLHRESKRPGEPTNLTHELRKRAWWVILTVYIAINGRRGLPMPITVEEFDVGFPEPIADELLSEDGIDTSRTLPCIYEVGICSFKIVPIMMEMWSNIYSVRRDAGNYVGVVNALEAQLKAWDDELPGFLKLGHRDQNENTHMNALYLRSFLLECRLCLRHPSVAMTDDRKMVLENARICESVSEEMLECQLEIQKLKCLDTTWYQMSLYAASIFTTLVAHWERRFETTPEAIVALRNSMNGWMGILEETGNLLGSGPQIGTEIGQIIDRTIAWIEHDMQNKDRKSSQPPCAPVEVKQEPSSQPSAYRVAEIPPIPVVQPAPAPIPASAPPSVSAPLPSQGPVHAPTHAPTHPPGAPNGVTQPEVAHKAFYQETTMNGQAPYPALAYNEQPQPQYDAEATIFFNASAQAQAQAQAQAAAVAAATSVPGATAGQPNPLMAFASQATQQHIGAPPTAEMLWSGRGNTWHDWTTAIADSQDRYNATTLLTLGGGPRDAVAPSLPEAASGLTTNDMNGMQSWPLTLFDNVTHNGS